MDQQPSHHLTPCHEAKFPCYVGVDLGGTNTKLGIVDDMGRTLYFELISTRVEQGPDAVMDRIAERVSSAIQQIGLQSPELAALGIGAPGILDFREGTMRVPVNFPGWENFPIRQQIRERVNMPVVLANDASAAAYGEFWVGNGTQFDSLVLLTLGTGIGAGIIIGDLIIEGNSGHGAECGHMIIDTSPSARRCGCGMYGHLEAYCGARATLTITRERLDEGAETSLRTRLEAGETLSPRLISEEAEAGDALCNELIDNMAKRLAQGIVSLLHTIDPACVLLGGAMTFGMTSTATGRRFLSIIRSEAKRQTFRTLANQLIIDYAQLGSDAGYIGSAGIARISHFARSKVRNEMQVASLRRNTTSE
ncbi:MAG: ROK family protein [Thermoguttaceae bacterium]|nr:ROK family protein [Thermoguttaceae bacterium]